MIDKEQFRIHILKLELSCQPGRFMDEESLSIRRQAVYDRLAKFPEETVWKAMDQLAVESDYFPSLKQIYETCLEFSEHEKPKERLRPPPPVTAHVCVPSEPNLALAELARIFPEEAKHVSCPVQQCTCPKCGKLHQARHPLIELLMGKYPEATQGWQPWVKTSLLCKECAK
jgi:hypothetical protein